MSIVAAVVGVVALVVAGVGGIAAWAYRIIDDAGREVDG